MIYKKVRLIEDQISALAIGCWNFGGDWDCSNDDNTREIVHAAIANGINFFDVAPVYGWYHSEEVLGKILEEGGLRNKVIIATKAAVYFRLGGNLAANDDFARRGEDLHGDAGVGIQPEMGVQNGVRHLIAELVGMTGTDGFRRDQSGGFLVHEDAPPFFGRWGYWSSLPARSSELFGR